MVCLVNNGHSPQQIIVDIRPFGKRQAVKVCNPTLVFCPEADWSDLYMLDKESRVLIAVLIFVAVKNDLDVGPSFMRLDNYLFLKRQVVPLIPT